MEWLDLYPVYEAQDEVSALGIQALLLAEGIEAKVRSAQVPGMDSVFAVALGYWGHVLVPRRDVIRAKEIIRLFHASRSPSDDTPAGEGRE